jgi:hypothetical protein
VKGELVAIVRGFQAVGTVRVEGDVGFAGLGIRLVVLLLADFLGDGELAVLEAGGGAQFFGKGAGAFPEGDVPAVAGGVAFEAQEIFNNIGLMRQVELGEALLMVVERGEIRKVGVPFGGLAVVFEVSSESGVVGRCPVVDVDRAANALGIEWGKEAVRLKNPSRASWARRLVVVRSDDWG